MGLSVGSSFCTTTISRETINNILSSRAQPYITVWERIKDFFFGTGHQEALNCLCKLCNPEPHFNSTDILVLFCQLKNLASPGYQNRFFYEFLEDSSTGSLYLKDEDGDLLIYIEMTADVCNYTILGKTFIFDTKAAPFFQQKCETNTPGLSIIYQESKSQSGSDSILWLKDRCYCISYGGDDFIFNFKEFHQSVLSFITAMQQGDDFTVWREQEKRTYLSAAVNKSIDTHAGKKQKRLSKEIKEGVFEHVKNNLGMGNLQLDSNCAQSSIKHCVLTLLNKDTRWNTFINNASTEREVKNSITTDMVTLASNQIFERMFGDEMKLPSDWNSKVGSLVRESIILTDDSECIMQ